MKAAGSRILTINGGSWIIKFAMFESLRQVSAANWIESGCGRPPCG
jgi:hypothetical protein